MNRRLSRRLAECAGVKGGREANPGQWQDWLVEWIFMTARKNNFWSNRMSYENPSLDASRARLPCINERERRIFEARRRATTPITLEPCRTEFDISREARPPDRGPCIPRRSGRRQKPAAAREMAFWVIRFRGT